MESSEMENLLQLRQEAGRLKSLLKLRMRDCRELLEDNRAERKTLHDDLMQLKQCMKRHSAERKARQEERELRRDIQQMKEKNQEHEAENAMLVASKVELELEVEVDHLEWERFLRRCQLDEGESEQQESLKEMKWRHVMNVVIECYLLEEHRKVGEINQSIDKKKMFERVQYLTADYIEHRRVKEERMTELQEQDPAAPEKQASSTAECEEVLEEEEQQQERSTLTLRGAMVRGLQFVLMLLLLCCMFVRVPSCTEQPCVPCIDLIQDTIRDTIEPYCTLHFIKPPAF